MSRPPDFEIDLRGVRGASTERVAVYRRKDRPRQFVCVGVPSTGSTPVPLGTLFLDATTGFLRPSPNFDADRLVTGEAILELHRHLRRFLRERGLLR